jgi:S1-C subfamily serine protease
MREILSKGRVVRGWIGTIAANAEPARAAQLGYPAGGVVIDDLYLDSRLPLRAGMDVNDRIATVDGKAVRNAQDANAQIALHPPGSTLKLGGQRGPQRFEVELKVIEMPTAR